MSGWTLPMGWYASSWNYEGVQGWRIRNEHDELIAWLAGPKADGPPFDIVFAIQEELLPSPTPSEFFDQISNDVDRVSGISDYQRGAAP